MQTVFQEHSIEAVNLDAGDTDLLLSTFLLLLFVLFLAASDDSGCDHVAT